jgi:hypothetical protein
MLVQSHLKRSRCPWSHGSCAHRYIAGNGREDFEDFWRQRRMAADAQREESQMAGAPSPMRGTARGAQSKASPERGPDERWEACIRRSAHRPDKN